MTNQQDPIDLAVLELALEEELGGDTPPELWQELEKRKATATHRPRNWLSAAIALLGVVIIVAVASDSKRDNESASTPMMDLPVTLAEARARLTGSVSQMTVRADAVFDRASGQTDKFYADKISEIFAANDFQVQSRKDRELIRLCLLRQPQQTATATRAWEYTLTVTCESKPVTVRITGCSQFPAAPEQGTLELAIVGRDQLFGLSPDIRFSDILRVDLIALSNRMLRNGPLAAGATGLRNLDVNIKRLRCVRVRGGDDRELQRFEKLQAIDLAESPELHKPATLNFVPATLQSLSLDASRSGTELLSAVGRFHQLNELFLKSPGDDMSAMFAGDSVTAASDDAAIACLGKLATLRELSIPGSPMTALGLQSLAKLPELTRLSMPNCDNLKDGFGAFSKSKLKRLNVIGCDGLTSTAVAEIASLPQLQQLSVSARPGLDLGQLRSSDSLRRLLVLGNIETSMIADLTELKQLSRLTLASDQELSASQLQTLRSALPNCDLRLHNAPEARTDPR